MTGFGLYMIVLQMSETASLLRKRCSIAAQAVQCGCMESAALVAEVVPRCSSAALSLCLHGAAFALGRFRTLLVQVWCFFVCHIAGNGPTLQRK